MSGPIRDKSEPFQQLESILLRQMLQSSGAFKAGSTPGAQLRTDMFVETLADAVAKAGGLGIARMLERQLGGAAAATSATSASSATAASSASSASSHLAGMTRPALGSPTRVSPLARQPTSPDIGGGDIDGLEDPNNDAPLPEDPAAGSIDDYQLRPSTPERAISRRRGLNSYRGRDEAKVAGTSFGASSGEEP